MVAILEIPEISIAVFLVAFVLSVALVPQIDIRQYRIVLGTWKNLYVFCGNQICFVLCLFLRGSLLVKVNLAIAFFAAACVFPTLEIFNIPTFGHVCMTLPLISFMFFILLKFQLTGVLFMSLLEDHHFTLGSQRVGTQHVSLFQLLAYCISITMFLTIAKVKMVYDIYNGTPVKTFQSSELTRVLHAHFEVDPLSPLSPLSPPNHPLSHLHAR
jgi:hypothetical protein